MPVSNSPIPEGLVAYANLAIGSTLEIDSLYKLHLVGILEILCVFFIVYSLLFQLEVEPLTVSASTNGVDH